MKQHFRLFRRLCGSVLLLAALGCGGDPGPSVWVIGLDGADWDILDPMIARGDLPNLARLRSEGAAGRLMSDEPMLSPILWTSIATGKTADLHGVTWFMSDAPDGSKIPVSSRNRWVRAVWNIASERDREVGIVGWWATWPAEPVNGFLVSDYVAWHSFGVTGRELTAPGKTHPPELIDRISFPDPASLPDALLQRMVNLPPDQLQFDAAAGPFGGPIAHLRQALATTLGYTDLTLDLLDQQRPDLLAVYYEGTDAAEHLFTSYAPPQLPWVSDEDFAAYKDVIAGYWKWQDEQLGRLLAARDDNTTVVIVSDHGFRTGEERLKESEFSIERADASHMPDGIIVMHGPGVAAGATIPDADIYDVTPTVLHLLGLPVAEDMAGRALTAAMGEEWNLAHPVTTIPTYELGDWDRGGDLVVDAAVGEEMEEMLRSLGYISGGGNDDGEAVSTPGNVEQAVNLSVVLRRQGKYAEAARTLEEVLLANPGHVEARANLARVYAEMGRLPEAEPIYRALMEEEPDDLSRRQDLALALAHQGKTAEVLAVYEAGLALDPDWTDGLAGKGFALLNLGRVGEALAPIDRALALDPRLAVAHYYRGVTLRDQGRLDDARTALERAAQLDPTHVPTAVQLSALREAAGDLPGALRVAEAARTAGSDDPELAAQLGALYLQSGRLEEARAELDRAVQFIRDDPMVWGNHGTALGMSGDLAGAARSFEKVVELDPSSVEGIGTLGQIYMQQGQAARAEQLFQDAVRRAPEDPRLHLNLGTFYHGTGRLAEAETEYRRAIELDDSVGLFHYQLAMLLGQQGKEAEAQRLVEKARALDPSLPDPRAGG